MAAAKADNAAAVKEAEEAMQEITQAYAREFEAQAFFMRTAQFEVSDAATNALIETLRERAAAEKAHEQGIAARVANSSALRKDAEEEMTTIVRPAAARAACSARSRLSPPGEADGA